MIRTRRAALVSLTMFLLGAVQGPAHRFEKTTRDGVDLVTNAGGPKYADELFTYEKILTIEPTEEEALLAEPRQFIADETGRYYVNDPQRGTILVFDPDGNYLNRIGRRGSGPGEFRVCSIMSARDGVVTVLESYAHRIQRFHPDGTLIDVITLEPGDGLFAAQEVHVLPDGNRISIRSEAEGAAGGETRGVSIRIRGPEGEQVFDVGSPQVSVAKLTAVEALGGRKIAIPLLFGPFPDAHYAPSQGIVLSPGDAPDLFVYGTDGRAIRQIHVDLPPEWVTARDREAAHAIMERGLEQLPEAARGVLRERVKITPFADLKAPWTVIDVDDSGYFWLQMALPRVPAYLGEDGLDTIPFRILSPQGEYLGITHRPNSSSTSTVSHGRLLVLETDEETGLRVPTVYAIRPAVSGFVYP